MTNKSTNSPASRQRRYTVSRLLELAPQFRLASFDLSRFTYDAARAGVVPPLGACVMSQRRTCSDRPRGWSQESGSSQEEVIVYQGNRAVKQPERQPLVPPTESRAQKDEGFAKFLKKHSSPTHQRVTTGGRIVPMERQGRPPVFFSSTPGQDTEDQKNTAFEDTNGIVKPAGAGHDQARVDASDNILHPQSFMPGAVGAADASTFSVGANASMMAPINTLNFDATQMQPNQMQPLPPAPYYPGMPGDPYGTMMMPSHMYQGSGMPFVSFNNGIGPVAMPYLPSPQILPPSVGITTTPLETQPQGGLFSEHMFNDSMATFQNLDEQLKGLDRHRAITEHDPFVADQRMAVVQLRAQAKEQMTFWSNKIRDDAQNASKIPMGAAHSRLNVQASSYVPLRVHQAAETSSDNSGSSWKSNGIGHGAGKPDFVVDSTRRPIAIVPPPGKSPSPPKTGMSDPAPMSKHVAVDEWGVRIGSAPPDVQRKQSEMLKEWARQNSISPQDSENAVMFTPQGSHGLTSPAYLTGSKASNADTDFGSESEWLPTKPGRAPANVEACYEVQLDAMRLPHGLITSVRLPDGSITEVPGCSLKRPPSFEMDAFEQNYWTTKPALSRDMFDNFVGVQGSGGKFDSASIMNLLGIESPSLESTRMRENAKGGLSGRDSANSTKDGKALVNVAGDATNAQTILQGISRHGYASTVEQPIISDARLSTLKLSSASSPPMWSRGDDKGGFFANEHSRNGRLAGSEALGSKGFSSVSIQNVHAMGRLPHVDGPSDGQRPSALAMLSAASKAASPQPTPAPVSAPFSESFYGPYPRESRAITGLSDDVFRCGMSNEQDM